MRIANVATLTLLALSVVNPASAFSRQMSEQVAMNYRTEAFSASLTAFQYAKRGYETEIVSRAMKQVERDCQTGMDIMECDRAVDNIRRAANYYRNR